MGSYGTYMGISLHGTTPKMVGLFHGKSQSKMDENWGYHYFRKPPYGGIAG